MSAPLDRRPVTRRRFLATSATASAGLAGILAAGRAPAFAQGTRLALLQWSHFVPAADVLFEQQAREFGKQAGVEVAIERINQNDIQARVTAAVQSGAGPDIIVIGNNHPQLYESALADVSDVAEEVGAKQGGWWDYAKVNCFANGKWVAVPHFIISWAVTYREDWFQQEGLAYPKTWDEFRTVGKRMKAKGRPFGQAFGHSINDPNAWAYPLVWMWGGLEIDKDGRTVALNSRATVEAVKFNNVLWKECFDEGGLAWDDSNNNRAFLSQEISLTGNAPSIYVAARGKFPDVYKGTNHGHYPPGPAGRFYFLPLWSSCVMKYGRQQKLAKDFIRFYMDRPQFDRYFEVMDTFGIPGTRAYRDHPLWKKDPKTAVFPETLQYARTVGHAGPPDRRATETLSKFILVDMFAKSIQGMRPEDAVAWAAGEIKKIYGA
jgi:multiple sugar transport system substrate-binding protein